jgi:SNF2 family DNA or RNA helicase
MLEIGLSYRQDENGIKRPHKFHCEMYVPANKARNKSRHNETVTINTLKGPVTEPARLSLYESDCSYAKRYDLQKFLTRVPGYKQVTRKNSNTLHYELPITDFTVEILLNAWPVFQRHITKGAAPFFQDLALKGIGLDTNAKMYAEYTEYMDAKKINTVTKSQRDKFETKNGMLLHPLSCYQSIASQNSIRSEGYALFFEQGCGKTPTAIQKIVHEAVNKQNQLYRAVVVCPKGIRENWKHEIEKFSSVKGKVTVLRGNAIQRKVQLMQAFLQDEEDQEFSVVICSYKTLTLTLDAFLAFQWDVGILDESHNIANFSTKQSKACLKLRDNCKSRLIMTGTPIRNTLFDLYTQLEFLGKGCSGFDSYQSFKEFHAEFERRNGTTYITAYRNVPMLQERLARLSFIIKKKEAMPELPEKVYDILECGMTHAQTKLYRQIASSLYTEIENELSQSKNQTITVNNILTRLLRLAQITSGFIKTDDIKDDDGEIVEAGMIERIDPNPKEELLIETLKEKETHQKTLIWSVFRQNIRQLRARIAMEFGEGSVVTYHGGTSDHNRAIAEQRINCDPSCRFFIGHPKAGGAGLNLLGFDPNNPDKYETAVDHSIYYSLNWSYTDRAQSEDRCHRRGTRNNIRISTLVVPNSIDMEILDRVLLKKAQAFTIQDVKRILSVLSAKEVYANGDS